MGCESGAANERPLHTVRLDRFAIARFPVTNRLFNLFIKETGRSMPPDWQPASDNDFNDPDQPVTSVNWFDATQFCEWRAKATGRPYACLPRLSGSGPHAAISRVVCTYWVTSHSHSTPGNAKMARSQQPGPRPTVSACSACARTCTNGARTGTMPSITPIRHATIRKAHPPGCGAHHEAARGATR
jgi:hypothetical protein